jgi:hypothetical protein
MNNSKKQTRKAYHPGIGKRIEGLLRQGWGNEAIIRKLTPEYMKAKRTEVQAIATLRVLICQAKGRLDA